VGSKEQGGNRRNTGSATVIPLRAVSDEAGEVEAGIEGLALHLTNALIELAYVAEGRSADISDAARLAAELLNLCATGLNVSQRATIEAVNGTGGGQMRRRQFLNTLKAVGGVALAGRVEQHLGRSQRMPLLADGDQVASITAITGNYRRLEA
jgi:hypothetical protein